MICVLHPGINDYLHALVGHAGFDCGFVIIDREVMAEQLLPGEAILVTQHQTHDSLVIGDVVGHADDAQVVGADLMDANAGIFAALHEVAGFEVHTGLAQILQTFGESLGTAYALADDVGTSAVGLLFDEGDALFGGGWSAAERLDGRAPV